MLGLYYKLQSFFFIPLGGLQTCIVPLLSYTYAKQDYGRCQKITKDAMIFAAASPSSGRKKSRSEDHFCFFCACRGLHSTRGNVGPLGSLHP